MLGEGDQLVAAPVRRRASTWSSCSPRTPPSGEAAADVAAQGDGLAPDEVVLLPPVYPVAMRDFLTFEAHVDGMERGHGNPGPPAEWYDAPVFLFMAPHAVTGPYDDVAMPPDTERLDFELEIAAIVCRDVRNVTPERGPRGHRRLLRDERLVRPRHPGQGDEAQARPVQGQGLRHHDRTLGGDRRRARRLPRRRRLPRPRDDRQGQRRAGRRRPLRRTWAGRSSSSSRTRRAPRG